MIIELYGLPGSGKTTFARRLRERCGYRLVRLHSPRRVLWYFFRSMFIDPKIFWHGLWFVVRHNPHYLDVWNFFCIRYAKYYVARACEKRGEKVIFDEGPLQNLLSIPQGVLSDQHYRQYLDHVPEVDKIIAFDVPQAVRRQRLGEKRADLRSYLSPSEKEQWEIGLENKHQAIMPLLEALPICRVIRTEEDENKLIQALCS